MAAFIELTKSEKLKALIQKAIEGGWRVFDDPENTLDIRESLKLSTWDGFTAIDSPWVLCNATKWHLNDIIFNHDFAQALFGNKLVDYDVYDNNGDWVGLTSMQADEYHLQQAVISEDPIEYMYKVIFSKESNE